MGNRAGICGGSTAQHCVDECARLQFELDAAAREPEDPECDPAGAVFSETLHGLAPLDQETLRFAGMSNLAAVRWLFAMGASPKARDRNGTTMLHAACRSGTCSIVQELVRRGLPLDTADSSGWTPLHIAAVMGRREVCLLLLRSRASTQVRNKRGRTPLSLCSDPGTKDVLEEYTQDANGPVAPAAGLPRQTRPTPDMGGTGGVPGPHDEYFPACEPFFVPRAPLFHDEAHRAEIIHIGMEMFNRSAGHGLAFFVSSGIVHDHPTDMSTFLLRYRADPEQLGEFLGEDFSLAQTLRLASIHAVDLSGTGVVAALIKSFQAMSVPPDLRKVDRLTSAIAHLWWRTHDVGGDGWGGYYDGADEDGLDWTLFVEDPSGFPQGPGHEEEEVAGVELRRNLHSAEGLRRMMFSTIMLCWNLHAAPRSSASAMSPRRLSLSGWMDMNAGLEADGSNIPAHVQKHIYQKLTNRRVVELLPGFNGRGDSGASESTTVPSGVGNPSSSSGGTGAAESEAMAVEDHSLLVKGWAAIPIGGLERQEPALQATGQRHCIVSESSSAVHQPMPSLAQRTKRDDDSGGEAVWLSLRFSFLLFLSSSPGDAAPYAFIRLQDAVLRGVERATRHIILAGRLNASGSRAGTVMEGEETGLEQQMPTRVPPSVQVPFGDPARLPLPLCFLLADGRFQPFEAQFLELQFQTDEDVDMWARELGMACDWSHSSNAQRSVAGEIKGPKKARARQPPMRQGDEKPVSAGSGRTQPPSDNSEAREPPAASGGGGGASMGGAGEAAAARATSAGAEAAPRAGGRKRQQRSGPSSSAPVPSAPLPSPAMVAGDGPAARTANPPRPAG